MQNALTFESASFSGHESFPLRFSWLKKGYDQIENNPSFFGNEDAMVVLGTGKNMVRAIRHWGIACQMWDEIPQSRGREMEPTEMGKLLLADDGWDPHLEEIGTIWWLHHLLVRNKERATAWTWTFTRPKSNLIRKDELVAELEQLIEDLKINSVSKASLKRDIDVLIRTYTRSTKRNDLEDALDAPFTLLNLVRPAAEKGIYEIVQGPQSTLPTGIFEASLIDYLDFIKKPSTTLDDLCYGIFSPGRTFRLTEEALVGHLAKLVDLRSNTYAFDETAGLRQLLIKGDPPNKTAVLGEFYLGAN